MLRNRTKDKFGALGIDNMNTLLRVNENDGSTLDCIELVLTTRFLGITGDPKMLKLVTDRKIPDGLRAIFERAQMEVLQLYAESMLDLEEVDYERASN